MGCSGGGGNLAAGPGLRERRHCLEGWEEWDGTQPEHPWGGLSKGPYEARKVGFSFICGIGGRDFSIS